MTSRALLEAIGARIATLTTLSNVRVVYDRALGQPNKTVVHIYLARDTSDLDTARTELGERESGLLVGLDLFHGSANDASLHLRSVDIWDDLRAVLREESWLEAVSPTLELTRMVARLTPGQGSMRGKAAAILCDLSFSLPEDA